MNGILLFAHDNDVLNYGELTYNCALMCKFHLKLPIALVVDESTWDKLCESKTKANDLFHEIIIVSAPSDNCRKHSGTIAGVHPYFNLSRLSAYELSPFEKTLVLDSDVIVVNDYFGQDFNINGHIVIDNKIKNLDFQPNLDNINLFVGDNSIPLYWATRFMFDKSAESCNFFKLAQYVYEKYEHYSKIYGYKISPIRVDVIFSIAAHMNQGYIDTSEYRNAGSTIHPFTSSLLWAWDDNLLLNVDNNSVEFHVGYGDDNQIIKTGHNVHCMNKLNLLSHSKHIESVYG